MCLHQGKTPADQAEGDSELATYLSTQKHPSSTTNEDLETAVWGSHTLTHTHSASLDSHTRSGDESEREKCKKKKKKKGNRTPSSPQRWTRRSRGVNCFSSQQHCSGDFNGQTIYLYLFIHILFIGCADWSTEWLIVGLLTVQDASALWAAVAGREFMKTMLFILSQFMFWEWIYSVRSVENNQYNIKFHFRTDGRTKGFYVYPIKPVCQRHCTDVVSYLFLYRSLTAVGFHINPQNRLLWIYDVSFSIDGSTELKNVFSADSLLVQKAGSD